MENLLGGYGSETQKKLAAEVQELTKEIDALENTDEISELEQQIEEIGDTDESVELQAKVKQLRDTDDIHALKEQREAVSLKLARWLRTNYPNNFLVYEFNGTNQPKLDSTRKGSNSGKAFGETIPTRAILEAWQKKYPFRQDDILIFHPTENTDNTYIFYMTSDNRASYTPFNPYGSRVILRGVDEILEKLGLTPNAAQRLWFPKGGLPVFNKGVKDKMI